MYFEICVAVNSDGMLVLVSSAGHILNSKICLVLYEDTCDLYSHSSLCRLKVFTVRECRYLVLLQATRALLRPGNKARSWVYTLVLELCCVYGVTQLLE